MTNESSPMIIEGLPGRLPFSAGGVLFFIASMIFSRIRITLYNEPLALSDRGIRLAIVLIPLLLLLTPYLHQACHWLVCVITKTPVTITRRIIYPRIRPAVPVSKSVARWFFAAPLLLSLVCMFLLLIKPFSMAIGFVGAINMGLAVNDIWKLIGLTRVPKFASINILLNHCEVLPIR